MGLPGWLLWSSSYSSCRSVHARQVLMLRSSCRSALESSLSSKFLAMLAVIQACFMRAVMHGLERGLELHMEPAPWCLPTLVLVVAALGMPVRPCNAVVSPHQEHPLSLFFVARLQVVNSREALAFYLPGVASSLCKQLIAASGGQPLHVAVWSSLLRAEDPWGASEFDQSAGQVLAQKSLVFAETLVCCVVR